MIGIAIATTALTGWGAPSGGTKPGSSGAAQQYQRSVAPARGPFPVGCKWRAIGYKGRPAELWDVPEYEYWDEQRQRWGAKQPAACTVRGQAKTDTTIWKDGSPRTEVNCSSSHCMYEKLWYNNGRWYLLVDGPTAVDSWKMTRNQDLNVLHVNDAKAFADGVDARIVTGDTLIFDFIYFLHPTAIGHWCEMMFPLFSILRTEPTFARPATQFVLLHLKRSHLMEWVRAVIAVTLGVAPRAPLPPIVMQQEQPDIMLQTVSPLEGYGPDEWVVFERALVVRDLFTGGTRTFHSTHDAQDFRASLYQQYDLPPPVPRPAPRTILFQRKRANRRILNEQMFLNVLREFGEVRVAEFNESTSFREQLEAVSSTGVYISVHTSNLANAPFLRPGSAAFELIQRNWIWHDLDKSFQVQTEKMGDLHHYAWRARHRNQTAYIAPRDGERFGSWTKEQCATEDCVEAHTNVDVIVNLEEFRELLANRLPLVFAGASVEEAALPWPPP